MSSTISRLAPRVALPAALPCVAILLSATLLAQNVDQRAFRVEVSQAPVLHLSGDVDSNSPAVWDLVRGRNTLFVVTSMNGRPSTASGASFGSLGPARQATIEPWPGGGVWMEAVVKDVDDTWYGYYHNELPANMCGEPEKVIPRIGTARSVDHGRTWEPLGVVLEAPPRTYDCGTDNKYFVGGVGDFTVQLDAASQDLYFFYSLYLRNQSGQGVGVARLAWADRDEPTGRIMVWRNGAWLPATAVGRTQSIWVYPAASPLFPTTEGWHDNNPAVNAFWGPSVHWNTYLSRYVMLMNRAQDDSFAQEGVYLSSVSSLENPGAWSTPMKILDGGQWYPQVLGLESGEGTDKTAGERARLFMLGTSRHFIRFIR
jgi:hypothetical protein